MYVLIIIATQFIIVNYANWKAFHYRLLPQSYNYCYIKMGAGKLAAYQSRGPAVAGPSNPVGVPIAGGAT